MKPIVLIPRYLVVGGSCALINTTVLVGAGALGLPLGLSIAVSFIIVCLAGYALHAAVTFDAPRHWRGFLRYTLAMAANLPMSTLLLWLFARVLHWPMALAAPAVTATMLAVNFLSSRWAITHPTRRTVGMSS
ncbi:MULTISPECIES: GtrA family protein [Sphingomonas]|uniref:GtrA family protein n=1 Tax=Sphingomonas kyungheensis TaxID=1069987 RepID=A0ABU8H7M3_9SPHN|nr:GtrA family protein [Sphingomonas sp. CV7422]